MLFNGIITNFSVINKTRWNFKVGDKYRSIRLKGVRAMVVYNQQPCTVEEIMPDHINVTFVGRSLAHYTDGSTKWESTEWYDSIYFDDIAEVIK